MERGTLSSETVGRAPPPHLKASEGASENPRAWHVSTGILRVR